jgi:hypothetical protein
MISEHKLKAKILVTFQQEERIFLRNVSGCTSQWQIYVPPALIIKNSAFCIYGFLMFLNVDNDYFLEQH